ncbi:hypothetical protein [Aliikangiella coralliicola]|uniref:Uncharacterized protein n=1 Tax=Aliikangiella coralliicola TaxID=2592383 RepID=A0A545U080_9GAMM|nr:hypothetical protein [Aliikangiella coralliicola]TQV82869.1 hypothetical protein FLL46_24170 [Aliikangiella coralliicola]
MSTKAQALIDGAMKGYEFVDGIQRRNQRDKERQEDRAEQAKDREQQRRMNDQRMTESQTRLGLARQSHEMQKKNFDRQEKMHERKDRGLSAKVLFDRMNKPDYRPTKADRRLIKDLDIELSSLADDATKYNVQQLTNGVAGYLSGKDRGAINSPKFLGAFNKVFATKINREFEPGVTPNYPGGKITGKQVAGIMPGKKPGTVVVDLLITGVDKDGQPFEYRAPATINRSTDENDKVKQIPVELILGDIQTRQHLANDDQQLYALRNQLREMMTMGGVEPQPRFSDPERLGAGFVQKDQNNRAHGIRGVTRYGGAGSIPKDQQMIEYYVKQHGLKPDDAIKLVNSKNSRSLEELASDIYLMKIRSGGEFAGREEKAIWLDEAKNEAKLLKNFKNEHSDNSGKESKKESSTDRKKGENADDYISRVLGAD